MSRFVKRGTKAAGSAPGTLVHIGERKTEKIRITVVDYETSGVREREEQKIENTFDMRDTASVSWINMDGVHEVEEIAKVGEYFQIHPLTLEDVVHTGQRPKFEDYEDYIYIVVKMLFYDTETEELRSEQVSIIVGAHYLISFQEVQGDVFEPVRERIRKGKGRIRKGGTDYLAYALMDAIVDHYFIILEKMGENIETVEEMLLDEPGTDTIQMVYDMKRELIYMRKQVWPIREMLGNLKKSESPLIRDSTAVFFNDVYDHTIQVIDTIESYRDVLSGMLDLYLSTVSNRMNEVMKVLTIIATIFIPITFIAGVFGMNFKFMPELEWQWGYPMVWGIFLAIALVMVLYFKKKKWL